MTPPTSRPPVRWTRKLLYLGVIALASTALLEIGLRVIDPFYTGETMERERFQGEILEPHAERLQAVLRPGVRTQFLGHEVAIGPLRMRGAQSPPFEKPTGTYRIAIAGDSIAFGWGVAEADAFPRVLERMLNDAPNKHPNVTRYEVINGGTPGWGLPAYYLWLEELGLRFAPDLVIVTFINNDLTDIITSLVGTDAPPDHRITLPHWLEWSYTARGFKAAADILRGTKGDFFFELEESEHTAPAANVACDVFARIAQLCGDTPLLVMDTVGDADIHRIDAFVDGMKQRGIPRIDAYLPRARYREEYAITPTDTHPNKAGHQRFAEWLFAWIDANR